MSGHDMLTAMLFGCIQQKTQEDFPVYFCLHNPRQVKTPKHVFFFCLFYRDIHHQLGLPGQTNQSYIFRLFSDSHITHAVATFCQTTCKTSQELNCWLEPITFNACLSVTLLSLICSYYQHCKFYRSSFFFLVFLDSTVYHLIIFYSSVEFQLNLNFS